MEQRNKGYTGQVVSYIEQIPVGSVIEIDRIVKKENKERFIEILKALIDLSVGWDAGWQLDFNDDYTKFRKFYNGQTGG